MDFSVGKLVVVIAVAYGIWTQVHKSTDTVEPLDEVYDYIVGEKSLQLHWPDTEPSGFGFRDSAVSYVLVYPKALRHCVSVLHGSSAVLHRGNAAMSQRQCSPDIVYVCILLHLASLGVKRLFVATRHTHVVVGFSCTVVATRFEDPSGGHRWFEGAQQ